MYYEWLISRLINNKHLEDGPKLDKLECKQILKHITEKTGKTYILIVNVNIDLHEINYDYILDESTKNDVLIQEWDNRYL